MFVKNFHWEKVKFRQYRLLVDTKYQTGILGSNIKTKFGHLTPDGMLTLFAGFLWDGATGALDTLSMLRASAFHDWFCTNVANGILYPRFRRLGDNIFKAIMIEDGAPMWRVAYAYFAVVTYGKIVVATL